jgi:PHS family inorganic phosphate transporter-like MFS transporter
MANRDSEIEKTSTDSYHKNPQRDEVAQVLDERRRAALAEIDNAKFSWFHVKVALVAGAGFFTDAYDLFAINIASTMLGYVYGKGQKLNANQDLGVKVAGPVGTLVGQLLFGWLADVVGRKRMYGIELMIIIIATFAQALSGGAHAVNIIGVLIVWRFIMGIGIGGDYPLSAVISSEFASTRIRGRLMTAVFAAQGWGNFTASLVAYVIVAAYKTPLLHDPVAQLNHVDYMWRLLIGLGCIPGCVALYFRLTIPETPRFTMDIERNVKQAAQDINDVLSTGTFVVDPDAVVQRVQAPKASRKDFAAYFSKWQNFKVLFGCAYSWFALDIAFYGLGLNSGIILQAIGFGSPSSNFSGTTKVWENLKNICVGNLILSAAGLIPGYWVSFLFIDSWGRKPIQLMGFSVLTVLFCILGFGFTKLTATPAATKGFVFLYCLANFFQNFGPNTTTFVIPGEAFPTRYRSTAHGISAASGKLGAIVAQVGFARLKDIGGPNKFVKHILELFAFFMLTGIFSTLLLPETKQRTLEELSNEDQDGFIGGLATRVQDDDIITGRAHH